MREVEVAVATARAAGRLLLEGWHQPHAIDRKRTPIDVVTEMDRRAEAFIVEHLRTAFPDYGFWAEEGTAGGPSKTRWIVDPLDGTVNYSHGHPHFAVSIALEREGEVVLGVVYHPVLDELFVAERGKGAWCNGKRLQVRPTAHLHEALLASGSPYDVHERPELYVRLWKALVTRAQAVRQSGAAALDLCYVAAGRLDGYVEFGLEIWDIAAGSLIVQEAGGIVRDWDGGEEYLVRGEVVATSHALYPALLSLLREIHAPKGR